MTTDSNAVVLYEQAGDHIALVTINREAVRNAINGDVAAALDAFVKQTEAEPDIWAVVLTGAGGKVFCAGADLKEIAAGRGEQLATRDNGFGGFTSAPRTKPWIAAVEGYALAGGLEIMLACDMVVASDNAQFGLPEVKRGLVALAGGVYRLPRAIPRALAIELVTTGDTLDAQRALAHGLVNRLTAPGGAKAEALKLAQQICVNAPIAVRESLKIARDAAELSEAELKSMGTAAWKRLAVTEDFKEGPRAFIEKRAPRWQGK
jgi:enoyl-CoA hydratase/carnithine racemase